MFPSAFFALSGVLSVFNLGEKATLHSQDDPLEIKQNQPNEKEFIKGQETDYFGFSGLFYTEHIGNSSFFSLSDFGCYFIRKVYFIVLYCSV